MANKRTVSVSAQARRDPSCKGIDKAALWAIAQAAVEVELFTIPLYMAGMYSIQGMHQITSQGNDFYKGQLWPGPGTNSKPTTPNGRAFNIVFSIFIQEMLHLQLASNMATAIGWTPKFTGKPLQDENGGWLCFGPDLSVIPHIIDLRDTKTFSNTVVNLGALTAKQLQLFLAIEQPDADARKDIDPGKISKYFPTAPFEGWQEGDPLPMFGTIGWMYQCYFDYLNIKYADGTTLWDYVYSPNGQQNDLFNNFSAGHPMREFMGFETTVALTYSNIAFQQVGEMMNAITDQGEGSILKKPEPNLLQAVESKYQPTMKALESDYPRYSDTGNLTPSADAVARGDNDMRDHYERFQDVLEMINDVVTWPDWLKQHGPWTAQDLQTPDYPTTPKYSIPTTAQIAEALNSLADGAGAQANYTLLSQAAGGAIAGVTTVLESFWSATDQAKSPVAFPFPSMSGSGDRMAICWAVFGKAPDLSIGLDPPQPGVLYHSCQGLDYNPGSNPGGNQCAPVTVFHSCRGSNGCRARGGCGFVQPVTGGGNCSAKLLTDTAKGTRTFGGCNPFAGPHYSAPGDNKCSTFGGCAVPISASQLFPKSGVMDLFSFVKNDAGDWTSVPAGAITFGEGESVHDVAWTAYNKVMNIPDPPPAPPPTTIRLAFPPST